MVVGGTKVLTWGIMVVGGTKVFVLVIGVVGSIAPLPLPARLVMGKVDKLPVGGSIFCPGVKVPFGLTIPVPSTPRGGELATVGGSCTIEPIDGPTR